MKRRIVIAGLLLTWPFAVLAEPAVIEVEVSGMTCAFCVEGLSSNLSKLPGVERVQVSLKQGLVRIEVDEGREIDVDTLKQTIIDAGFTPGDVRDTVDDRDSERTARDARESA